MFELPTLTRIKGNDLKWRLARSGALLVAYLAHGMGLGVVGPTMLDIQIRTNSSITDVTYIIIGRAAGLSIGSFLAGPIASLIDTQLAITIALITASLTMAGVPWPYDVKATIGTFFVGGLGFGVEETSLYLYMLYLWGSECEPFVQALHFSFGVGASIAPLIAREFILPRNESFPDQWSPDDVQVYWCYEVIAVCCLAAAILMFSLYKFAPKSDEHESRIRHDQENRDKKDQEKDGRQLRTSISCFEREKELRKANRYKVLCIILLCLFCFFYCGIEVNFGAYLTPYAVDGPIKMSKADGALIATVYWGVFTFSRLLTIFYIKSLGSRNNLILCSAILLCANIVLIPFAENESCLWIGTVLIGIGASSVLASIFGYLELSIKLTPLITSCTIASGCLGQSLFPIITSQLIVWDIKIFLWLTLFAAIAMAISLAFVVFALNYYQTLIGSEINEPEVAMRPSFGRLNSIVSVVSDQEKKNRNKKQRNG